MTRIRFEDLPSTNTPRNAENLNKLNNVVISPTEPITGEEVWIDDINKKIYTKNDSGVYEKFYDETNKEVYSTTERVIGTWLNGKKLYRRVYTLTITSGYAGYTLITSMSDVEQVVNVEGFHMLGGTDWRKTGCSEYPDGSELTRFLATKNNNGIWNIGLQNIAMTANMDVYAIVEYTKTTD